MTGEVIQNLGIAGFAILVFYFVASRLLNIVGSFIKDISQALRENAAAVNDLRTLLTNLEFDQIERDNDTMNEIRANFDRQRQTLDSILLAMRDCNERETQDRV